jgi:hypothetical protein
MKSKNILYVVHCVDTEGPMLETLEATFERLESIFNIKLPATKANLIKLQEKALDLGGKEDAVAKCFSPELLKYNSNWSEIDLMLNEMLSEEYRKKYLDDFGNGWKYSWHCMDHIGYLDNPRHKDVGYGNVFRFYKNKLAETESLQDEINWHFHPLSFTGNPLQAATSYVNSYETLVQILCRRILLEGFFPVVNRPGFHSERPDSHLFLEQWIPFDYANQACDEAEDQPDLADGRFGDWKRAPKSWRGYHPSHDDHQVVGGCNRLIFRCLNVGTRLRPMTMEHVREAFSEARDAGSAILSFADHDYRDMTPDVEAVRDMLAKVREEFPDVLVKFSGAEEAATSLLDVVDMPPLRFGVKFSGDQFIVEVLEGEIFGPQPFLAIKTKEGHYYHDNLDVVEPRRKWTYTLDEQTMKMECVMEIGVGSAGKYGGFDVVKLEL